MRQDCIRIYPTQQQQARAAIQWLSTHIRQQHVFTHLGWRKLGDAWLKSSPLILYCLPPNAGLNGVEELQSAAPSSALVLVVRDLAAELGHQALEMGVRGVVSTSARPETLRECLRLSSSGRTWVDSALSAELLGAHSVSLSLAKANCWSYCSAA